MSTVLAILAVATAVVTLVTVIIGLVVTLRSRNQIRQVHVLVDGRMSTVLERVEQLSEALRAADVDVPPNHLGKGESG